jgi:hypothetical protein
MSKNLKNSKPVPALFCKEGGFAEPGVLPVILEGDDPERLRQAALRFAASWMWDERKVLAGLHVDAPVLDNGPDTMIKVDDIRAIRRDSLLRPFDSEVKVYIVAHAHNMNASAQNALLRLLEEPPRYVRFVLTTRNASALLPTVCSRCVIRRVAPVDNGQFAVEGGQLTADSERAEAFVDALGDSWARMAVVYSWDKLSRDALRGVLNAVLACLRDRCLRDGANQMYTETIRTVSGLLPALDLNASPGSVCGALAVQKENYH